MAQRAHRQRNEGRAWDGVVAEANDLDEVRTWVVWGDGPTPEREADPRAIVTPPGMRPGNDIAEDIARGVDPGWAELSPDERWLALVELDENDVDEWTSDDARVRGYTPYLIDARQTKVGSTEPMRGVLRSDSIRRRKPGRMDAGRPN